MRSMIDKFVAALLNEERETAAELLRQYIITKAQDIHESLRQGEHPVLAEDISEDIDAEKYFTDDELSDDSAATVDAAGDDLSGDLETGSEDAAVETGDEDADLDSEASEDGEVSDDERLDSIESQLDELTAEFERMMAEIDGEDDATSSEDGEVLGTDDEVTTDVDGDAEVEKMAESDISFGEDDDFDDISEAIIDDLEKIKTVNTDGREAGNKTITQNNKSLPFVRDTAAHPIKTKNVTHKGFERETAPGNDRLPKGINTMDKAAARNKPVSKEGDASAELNKPVKQNNVSPVAKLKK
jgi:hypothetical protein